MAGPLEREENLPLIAFTALAPVSVGGLLGLLMDGAGGFAPPVVLAVALLALVASLFHLGHPARAYRAIVGLPSSWLSREVLLFGLFLAGLAGYTVAVEVAPLGVLALPLGIVAVACGLLSLFASGRLYQLQSRPAWSHWTALLAFPTSAISGGVPLGIFLSAVAFPGMAAQADAFGPSILLAMTGLVASVVLTALRLGRLRRAGPEEQESWRLASGRYLWALLLRVVGSATAFALLVTGGPGIAIAWALAALGELAERVLFFNAVVPVSMPARAAAGLRRRPQASAR